MNNKLKKKHSLESDLKVNEGSITEEYYAIEEERQPPIVTKDFKILTYFKPEFLDLECFHPDTYDRIKGFENLPELERNLLMLILKDKRDNTNLAQQYLDNEPDISIKLKKLLLIVEND